MKHLKAQLLAATVVAAGFPTLAQAQFVYPASELRGAGASSIQTAQVQIMNCIGNPGSHAPGNNDNLNLLGTNNGTTSAIPEGKFVQTSPSNKSPDYDCNLQEIQPNFQGKYVATGSGTGRTWWRTFVNQLDGSPGKINPFGNWTNVKFAFSDAPASASDLAAYDAGANNATNRAGAPIQFPLYVLPVAIAYNPVYARYRDGGSIIDLTLQVNPAYVTTDDNGNPTGGLRLTRNMYCKIVNGYLTNFNAKDFEDTGTKKSLKDPKDPSSRWSQEGAPIRLVGRLDNSGTTDVFTRHLAAACTGQAGVQVNKFTNNAEALPFDTSSSIDLRQFRSDTRYFPGSTAVFAGTVQSLSGAVFVRAAGGNPARIDTTYGQEQAGLFMVADGSSGVRDAINFQPEPAANQTIVLNGKVGYIGSDFVKPVPGAALFSAALQVNGTGKNFASPTAADATLAFGKTTLPPQTTSSSGRYDPSDKRTGPRRDGQPGTVTVDRANPLHWTSVLYSDAANNLALPKFGYPITGTTQYLGYTCYANEADRLAVDLMLTLFTSEKVGDSTKKGVVSTDLVTGTSSKALGLIAQLGLAPMPAAWQTAIHDTFLVKDSTNLGARNLWIQDKLPKRRPSDSNSNPNCTDGKGA
jgi:ABC-type phosphate transport system substrate-binding protein